MAKHKHPSGFQTSKPMNAFGVLFRNGLGMGIFLLLCSACKKDEQVKITGEMNNWHTITFTIPGPDVGELAWPNPFLDYRLEVLFIHEKDSLRVPGFYAADGMAAQSGATKGNAWQVRFVPSKEGIWTYQVSMRSGKNVAISDELLEGDAAAGNGLSGTFSVAASDKKGNDFRAKGRLRYDGSRYLKQAGSGKAFLKTGADSPENFLAYAGFDGTVPRHRYTPHEADWREGDPCWHDSLGKGIIGTVNYLASQGVNSIYALSLNIYGDGNDVWMYTDKDERYRFDCSKLDQWELVFSHMERQGVMIHLVTQENENQLLLDNGWTGTQRKLYYRELIARFGHHLAITFNLGEENGWASWYKLGQTYAQRLQMAEYFEKHDPYKNFTVVHTLPGDPEMNDYLMPFLGKELLDGPSLQVGNAKDCHHQTLKWIKKSADYGRPWVVCIDEIGPWYNGAFRDEIDLAHDTIRREVLWGNLMAGGAGVEWYFGRNDLSTEDFRPYARLWEQSMLARTFFEEQLPFTEMQSRDALTADPSDYCFAKEGECYVIYLPYGGMGAINLENTEGLFDIFWYNPRQGGELRRGTVSRLPAGGRVSFGAPPADSNKDWVAILKKK